MAQQVTGKHDVNNMGSRKVTHKTMEMKPQEMGMSTKPTRMHMAPTGEQAKKTNQMMPAHGKVGTHY